MIKLPYEIWTRAMAEWGMSWEQFYRGLPKDVVLMPPDSNTFANSSEEPEA